MGHAERKTEARPALRVIAGGLTPRPSTTPYIAALDVEMRPVLDCKSR